MAKCKTCGAPVNLAPDGDPKYEAPRRNVIVRPASWQPIRSAKKDGTLYLLLVYYGGEDEAFPLEDADFARTIGFNNFEYDGEDRWQFAGWCWSHDHFTEGRGRAVAFTEIGVTPAEDGALGFLRAAGWSPASDSETRGK